MHFTINGREYTEEKDTTLLDYLRNTLSLTGTKDGCSEGACGTCSVIINGKLRKACTQKLSKLDGADIITIEGLSEREKAVYGYAFAEAGAVQCGYCIDVFHYLIHRPGINCPSELDRRLYLVTFCIRDITHVISKTAYSDFS